MRLTILLLSSLIGRTLAIPEVPEELPTEMQLLEERYYNELENHIHNMYEAFCPWCINYCRFGKRPDAPPGYGIRNRRHPQLPFMPPDLSFATGTPCPEQCSAQLSWFLTLEVRNWWHVILPKIPWQFEFWRKQADFQQHGQRVIGELLEDGRCMEGGGRGPATPPDTPSIGKARHWTDDFPQVKDAVLKGTWSYPDMKPKLDPKPKPKLKPKPELKPRPKWPGRKETDQVAPAGCTTAMEKAGKCKGAVARIPVLVAGKLGSGRDEEQGTDAAFSNRAVSDSKESLATLAAQGATLLSAPFWKAIPGWFFRREVPL